MAVRVPYQHNGLEGVGVVDLAGGGVPMVGASIADIDDLTDQKDRISFNLVNERAGDFYRTYYTEEYLDQVYLGFTPASDVIRYFNFIEIVYLSFGSPKLEKMLYDGLALLFGQYYHIYVDDGFLEQFETQILLFKSLLLTIRICLSVLVGLLLAEIYWLFKERDRA
ncbi:hypothetical protein DSCA_12090 [Desulfosarcina alkanivorans]|uniref:Uncharacterized protein n=1 Tax=Desulfosarcina alkanivorans TaxID=571177 RepID=A0A5K7YHF7_9BACT|nr:hypothetical protein DSCA_12090 [Desulfosarcina alkanivorans]